MEILSFVRKFTTILMIIASKISFPNAMPSSNKNQSIVQEIFSSINGSPMLKVVDECDEEKRFCFFLLILLIYFCLNLIFCDFNLLEFAIENSFHSMTSMSLWKQLLS